MFHGEGKMGIGGCGWWSGGPGAKTGCSSSGRVSVRPSNSNARLPARALPKELIGCTLQEDQESHVELRPTAEALLVLRSTV